MWKKLRKNYKRVIAFMLTMAMTFSNMAANMTAVFAAAGEEEEALFVVDGLELAQALREAKKNGEDFDYSSLDLKARTKKLKGQYEKMLKDGNVYQLDMEIDDSYAPDGTGMEVFYNEETDDVIFLFINGSDLVVNFRASIDGYETEPLTIGPNAANVELDDEEAADFIEDAATKLPEKEAPKAEVVGGTEAEDADEEAEDADKADEDKAGEANADESVADEADETEDQADTEENGEAEDQAEKETKAEEVESEEETTEAEDEVEAEEETEGEEPETEEETEAEDEAEAEEPEAEEEEDAEPEEDVPEEVAAVTVSLHEVQLVATDDNLEETLEEPETTEAEEEAEADEQELEEEKDEDEDVAEPAEKDGENESEKKEETDAPETEKGTEAVDPKADDTTTSENKEEVVDPENQGNISDSENEGQEPADPEKQGDVTDAKNPEESDGTEEGKTDENGETPAEGTEAGETVAPADGTAAAETETTAPEEETKEDKIVKNDDEQFLDDTETMGVLEGKDFTAVALWENTMNAAAYRVSMEDLQVILDAMDFDLPVEFQVGPEEMADAARIHGDETAVAGELYTFAVETEEGYGVASVTANGEEVEAIDPMEAEADGDTDWTEYENVYQIEVPEEELVIEVELEEVLEGIPAATYTGECEDAVFTIEAPEGAFEEEVELKVTKIEDEEELAKISEQAGAAVEGAVAGLLAYDVTFVSKETGEEVEPQAPVSVSVSLKTAVVDESVAQEDITGMSIVHVPDEGEAEVVAEAEAAAAMVSTAETSEEAEIKFEAESFSTYVFTAISTSVASLNGQEYNTLQAAIDAIKDGSDVKENEIKLLMDIRENIKSEGKNYTLDMGNYVIDSVTKDISVYEINGGTVELMNGTLRGGFNVRDKVQSNWRKVADGLGLRIVGGAQVTITDLTVCDNKIDASRNGDPAQYGVGVYVGEKGTSVNMTGCVVSDNYSDWKSLGIGVAAQDGAELTMKDCVVENNRGGQTSSGSSLYGMIYVEDADFTGDKLTIQNNAFESGDNGSSGSAIRSQGGTVTLTNSEIHGNSDNMSSGGSVVSLETGIVQMDNVTISGNESPGSTLSLVGMAGDVKNVTVSDNTHGVKVADSTASGSVKAQTCEITFENVTIKDNNGMVSSSNSPLTVNTAGSFTMRNSAVTGHERENSGSYGVSAVSLSGSGEKRIENCEIRDNTMRATGSLAKSAAVTNEGGTLELLNCTITENTCSVAGGLSVYSQTTGSGSAVAPGKVTVEGCTIENNTANGTQLTSAGAILVDGLYANDEITVSGTTIQGNTGHSRAGAIYKKGKGTMTVTDSVIKENKLESKTDTTLYETAGVYIESGSFTMKSGALYNNEIVKGASLGKDVYVSSSSAIVNILAAKEMTEEGVDFSEYKWQKNGSSFLDTAIPSKTTGSYTAVSGDLSWEAMIGENKYATLKDAIAVVNNSTNKGKEITIELNEKLDKIVSKALSINQRTAPLTINMNGVFLQGDGVTSGGLITLKQGSTKEANGLVTIEGPGTIWAGGSATTNNYAVNVNAYARLHLTDVKIKSNTGTGSSKVYGIQNNGETTIDGESTAEELNITDKGTLKINQSAESLVVSVSKGGGPFGASSPTKVTMDSSVKNLRLSGLSGLYVIAGENFSADTVTVDSTSWIQTAQFNSTTMTAPDTPLIVGNVSEDLIPRITYLQMPTNPYVKFALSEADDNMAWKADGEQAVVITRSEGDLVYLGGTSANDTNNGKTYTKPVKTFKKAVELLEKINMDRPADDKLDTIFITGQVDVGDTETWDSPSDGPKLTLIRNEKNYKGTLVNVTGDLTLKNITIDGGYKKFGVNATAEMITVKHGKLTLDENSCLQNNYNSKIGGAVYGDGAEIIMSDGSTIQDNYASNGGGIAIKDSTLTMRGGTISRNTATSKSEGGGGVYVSYQSKMVMQGGLIQTNTAYNGGGIGVGLTIYNKKFPTLEMYGGVIDDNTATSQGGGLYFQSQTKGEIHGGSITNNECYGQNSTGGLFGGGGIYVNGGKGGYPDGELHIYDALITANTASTQGGALAGCPTSTDQIYLDGGVIAGNTGANGKNDVYINGVPIAGMTKGNPTVFLSTVDIKGRPYHWTNVGSKQEVPVSKVDGYVGSTKLNVYTDLDVPEGEEHAVLISGNSSSTSGGAIGTNGKVIIGGGTTKEVSVEKKWVDSLGKDLPADDLPVRIRVKLYRGIKVDGAEEVTWEEEPIAYDELTALQGWKKTFKNLAAQDADGNAYSYMVKEDTEDPELKGKYLSTSEWDPETNTWTITNSKNFGLKLTKQVSIGENSTVTEEIARGYEFKFLIRLEDKEGNKPYTGEVQSVFKEESDAVGENRVLTFENGTAEVVLKWGQSIQLNGLPEGLWYKITETESHHADDITVKYNDLDSWRPVENVADPVELGTNDVIFQNNYGDSGALTVKKTVSGAVAEADADKEFTFTVTLTDKAINGVYGDMDFTKGVAIFNLKANESKTAVGLPAGRIYIVEEEDADGYKAVYAGEVGSTEAKGIIEKGKTTEVVVDNEATGGLTVSKKIDDITNNLGDKTRDFTFTVELDDKAVSGKYGDLEFTEGVATFTLHDGQSVTATGLRAGMTYTVTESDNEGYIVSVSGTTDTQAKGTIEHHETASAAFVNTFIRNTGNLAVTKTVTGSRGDTNKEFNFTVTLSDDTITGAYGEMNFTGGVATFTLKHGDKKTADGLPAGTTYSVTETEANQDGYTTSSTGENGTIEADQTAEAAFTNNRGGGGGGNSSDGGNPPPSTTTINNPDVPLASLPNETPDLVDLEEAETPLAALLPKTGDSRHMAAWMMLFGAAGVGMLGAALGLMKKHDEDGDD